MAPVDGSEEDSLDTPALRECRRVARSIGKKADKNKLRARLSVLFLIGANAAIPVTIGLANGEFLWGKALPSVLAALAALTAGWVQIEKPHERWNLYRRYQRTLEAEELLYRFERLPYSDDDRDQMLAERVAQLQLELHDEWAGLLPRSSDISSLSERKGR